MAVVSNYTALISGYSWNGMTNSGTPVFVSYAFLENNEVPSLSEYQPYANSGYHAFSVAQRASFRQALAKFENVSAVKFIEVDDPAHASINVMNTSFSAWGGWAGYGSATEWWSDNPYLVIDSTSYVGDISYAPGSWGFEILLHELGHSMGLKHPFSGDPTLASNLDNESFTLMSYTDNFVNDTTLAFLDVDALQYLYGGPAEIPSAWNWSWSDTTMKFSLSGSGNDDELIGIDADSIITGLGGNDVIWGRDGNDTIEGGAGADDLNGGGGVNTLSYKSSSAAVSIDILFKDASGGHATGDTIRNFTNITGTVFNDTLTGDYNPNILIGRDGDDEINGLHGHDRLLGGKGGDTLHGGIGNDTADYTSSGAGVTARLWNNTAAGGHATGDTFTSIENLAGSTHADLLEGNGSANILTGRNGNDVLKGRGGADTLVGGAGADILNGDNNNDTLIGGIGGDTLQGGRGTDILQGGIGKDMADYSGSGAAVTVKLWNGSASGGHATGDSFSSIENLSGSSFGDILQGNGEANMLRGLSGNDTLNGRNGNDGLHGGNGRDIIGGGNGRDNIFGGAGNDILKGDDGQDTLTGGAGNDSFLFKDLNESGVGASKRDTITDFSPGNDKIDVSAIDAITGGGDDSFTFVGSSAFTSTAGELRAFNSGAITLVQMDVDGDGVSESTIELAGTLALTAGDFIL